MVIAITGGIATGKTTVALIFAKLGAEYLDADQIARQELAPGSPALEKAVQRFGTQILLPNGSLDRKQLGQIVFSDDKARSDLEAICHPGIIASIKSKIESFRAAPGSEKKVLVVEIPLLFECGLQSLADKVIVVAAEQATQLNRLINRDGLSRQQAANRISAQMPLHKKAEFADWIVTTECPLHEIENQVRRIWSQLSA